jgi:hypothetical protein
VEWQEYVNTICLGITNKCINYDPFIISLCCSYMFRQLCTILWELVCTFWVTCQLVFLVDKILCSMWLCVYYVAACRSIRTRPPHNLHITHTTQNFINQKLKLACNSEGRDELLEDGTQVPKHVGAAKWNNKLIRTDAFVGYFLNIEQNARYEN